MEFVKKLAARNQKWYADAAVTIVCFGDSNTQGGFECYVNEKGVLDTVVDTEASYGSKLKKALQYLYPKGQITLVNSGICGDVAKRGLERIEKDVVRYQPDLTVVSFGGNDMCGGIEYLDVYKDSLRGIFQRLQEIGSEVIFLATDVKNTYVRADLKDEPSLCHAKLQMDRLKQGVDEIFFSETEKLCKEYGVKFCNCHKTWKKLQSYGVDTTSMLANGLNHPPREMHWAFAVSLLETIFE